MFRARLCLQLMVQCTDDAAGRLDGPGFQSLQGQKIFSTSNPFRLAVGSTPPPIQWVLEQLGLELDHARPTSLEMGMSGALHLQPRYMPSWSEQENLTLLTART